MELRKFYSHYKKASIKSLFMLAVVMMTLSGGLQAQSSCSVTPTGNGVNVRSGPGTDYEILDGLAAGEEAEAIAQKIGTDEQVWWQLLAGGWVSSTVVDESGDCEALPAPTPRTYYVSKNGDNSDGVSWATAWNELDQINWRIIQPGDTLLLDGGETEMIYSTTLRVQRSGAPSQPIRIELAGEPGRNGGAVIFGGRSVPLPYCRQTDYEDNVSGVRQTGILMENISWVVIDGIKWRGIRISGHDGNGIRMEGDIENITVRNVVVFDNGTASEASWGWRSDSPGVRLTGTGVTLERMIIHDNGQDAIQAAEVEDFVLRESWLYNERQHPTEDQSFNFCTHTDGIQIYDGGSLSGFLVERTIIGPGFTNGLLLGEQGNSGAYAEIHNVHLRDVLVVKAANNSIVAYPDTPASGWILERVTADCSNTTYYCLYLEGADHVIRDSIIFGAQVALPDQTESINNCQWDTEGAAFGAFQAPAFQDVNQNNAFSIGDYAQLPSSPCDGLGSRITSPEQLFNESNTES